MATHRPDGSPLPLQSWSKQELTLRIRELEAAAKALILMLGEEKGGGSRITIDGVEMSRVVHYNLMMGRNMDPYRMILEVLPK